MFVEAVPGTIETQHNPDPWCAIQRATHMPVRGRSLGVRLVEPRCTPPASRDQFQHAIGNLRAIYLPEYIAVKPAISLADDNRRMTFVVVTQQKRHRCADRCLNRELCQCRRSMRDPIHIAGTGSQNPPFAAQPATPVNPGDFRQRLMR